MSNSTTAKKFKFLSSAVLDQMKSEHQSRKDKQFKSVAPYSESELDFINELIDACFSDLISQNAIIVKHKEFKKDGSNADWFTGIDSSRTHTDFRKKFVSIYGKRKDLLASKDKAAAAKIKAAATQSTPTPDVVVTPPPAAKPNKVVEPTKSEVVTADATDNTVAIDWNGIDISNPIVQSLMQQDLTNPAIINLLMETKKLA